VLDIKPYVPYADAIADATPGFAPKPPGVDWPVRFTDEAERQIALADPANQRRLKDLIVQVLRQDPRPGYMDRYPERTDFGMRVYELEVSWRLEKGGALITSVAPTPALNATNSTPPTQ
jgi:hypothetical protein